MLLKASQRLATIQSPSDPTKTVTYKQGYTWSELAAWHGDFKRVNSDGEEELEEVFGVDWSNYFNRADVRAALHIPDYIPPYEFSSELIFTEFGFNIEGSIFINDILKINNFKMLHIFGDTDGACSLLGTKRYIKSLKWKKTVDWAPWVEDDQLFGYQVSFGNFTLATVHGQGHQAIYYRPKVASKTILNFIHGEAL